MSHLEVVRIHSQLTRKEPRMTNMERALALSNALDLINSVLTSVTSDESDDPCKVDKESVLKNMVVMLSIGSILFAAEAHHADGDAEQAALGFSIAEKILDYAEPTT